MGDSGAGNDQKASDGKAADHDDVEREATRVRLIEATIDLLNRGGNHALRLADVARETDVAVSTIYAHFRDRTDLVAAARLQQFRARSEQSLRAVEAAIDRADEATSLADMAFWPTLRSPDEGGARTRRWDRVEAIADARHIPELASQLEALQSGLTSRATELTRRAQEQGLVDPALDPAALALLTQVLRLGLILWDLSGDARPSPEAWSEVITRLADATTAPAPPQDQPRS